MLLSYARKRLLGEFVLSATGLEAIVYSSLSQAGIVNSAFKDAFKLI